MAFFPRPTVFFGPLRVRRVRLRPLAVHGQPAPVADAAVGADLLQALDRLGALAPQVALDLEVRVDVVAELRDLLVREVADLLVAREPELGARSCARSAWPIP